MTGRAASFVRSLFGPSNRPWSCRLTFHRWRPDPVKTAAAGESVWTCKTCGESIREVPAWLQH